jgi:hypothetical protein
MNKWIKKLLGVDKIEADVAAAIKAKTESEQAAKEAQELAAQARALAEQAVKESAEVAETAKAAQQQAKEYAKMLPKERATANKEPYVAVLETHVNDQNPRNGFFELDWNEYFIIQLKAEGYFGETDEEIIDKWWREICRNVAAEEGVNMDRRGSGYINVNDLGNGKSEIS